MKTELTNLRKELKRIEERAFAPNLCLACGKPLMPEFKICPYCGEHIKIQTAPLVSIKNYK
jgi:rRNA maturation endonuclease Nob1